jgi:hypothetical protein
VGGDAVDERLLVWLEIVASPQKGTQTGLYPPSCTSTPRQREHC